VLKFGYLKDMGDEENYQGAAAQYWGFDEAGQLRPQQMGYLKTRARRRKDVPIPIRFRYSANPGGIAHEFLVTNFVLGAPANGRLFIPSRAVDNPGLDLEYLRRLESLDDEVLKAQMLNGDWGAVDRSDLVCPEWTTAADQAYTVTEDNLPAYFTAYASADPGGHSKEQARDLFAMLWGHLDFVAGVLFVTDEYADRNPDTETIGVAAVRAEAERWGPEHQGEHARILASCGLSPEAWGTARREKRIDGTIRVTDQDGRLVNDLIKPPYLLSWTATQKTDATVWERQLRTAIKQGKLRVHARCRRLLKTLKYARWNDNRTDYERTEETGHADLWKALVYMFRNVQWSRNPYPANPLLPEDRAAGRRPQPRSQNIRALQGAFQAIKPLK
jgi:hypothetical protein